MEDQESPCVWRVTPDSPLGSNRNSHAVVDRIIWCFAASVIIFFQSNEKLHQILTEYIITLQALTLVCIYIVSTLSILYPHFVQLQILNLNQYDALITAKSNTSQKDMITDAQQTTSNVSASEIVKLLYFCVFFLLLPTTTSMFTSFTRVQDEMCTNKSSILFCHVFSSSQNLRNMHQ